MFLSGYLKSRVEQFYSDLPGLLITGDNKRTSRWEILHRKITRPWKGKLLGLGSSPSFRALLAPRISRGHFFLVNFFCVTHDILSKRGTTRSLGQTTMTVYLDRQSVCFPIIYLCTFMGLIKGRYWANWLVLGMSLPAWFDHLEESFSYGRSSVQIVLPTCHNQFSSCWKP